MDAVSPVLPTNRYFVTQLLDSLAPVPPPTDQAPTNIDNANTNPLNNVPDATRKQLLSLQVLFPNEFVPALDLLDRRLVTRFRICDEEQLAAKPAVAAQRDAVTGEDVHMHDTQEPLQSENTTERHGNPLTPNESDSLHQDEAAQEPTANNASPPPPTIYYVRSAQQRSSRYSTSYDTTTSYQVRLQSWNCSCPAFAFAAFPAVGSEQDVPVYNPLDPPAATLQQDRMGDAAWTFGGITLGSDMPPVCKHLLACVLVERVRGLFGQFVEEKDVGVEEAAGWAAGWGD
jgi:hypothetical protein